MPDGTNHVGRATSRVDGLLKVTGQARYAAEYPADGLLHGCLVLAPIAAGRIVAIDTAAALALAGRHRGSSRTKTAAARPGSTANGATRSPRRVTPSGPSIPTASCSPISRSPW